MLMSRWLVQEAEDFPELAPDSLALAQEPLIRHFNTPYPLPVEFRTRYSYILCIVSIDAMSDTTLTFCITVTHVDRYFPFSS